MKVLIGNKRVTLGEHSLEYYPYYFDIWKDGVDHRIIVKNVLSRWASALTDLVSSDLKAVYLPYYLDDQDCKYLKVEFSGEKIVLTDMLVADSGYAMNLDELSHEMYSEPKVIESWLGVDGVKYDSSPKFFGQYNAQDLITALRDAEISDA